MLEQNKIVMMMKIRASQ